MHWGHLKWVRSWLPWVEDVYGPSKWKCKGRAWICTSSIHKDLDRRYRLQYNKGNLCCHSGWDDQGKLCSVKREEAKNKAHMLEFEFSREQPLKQSFVLKMFIEECTWNPHLQKGCGGGGVRQREKLSCSAAPRRSLQVEWPIRAVLYAVKITRPLYPALVSQSLDMRPGRVWTLLRALRALFAAEATPGWAESSLVCPPSSYDSRSLLWGIWAAGLHVHHTEKCRHVRGEQIKRSLKSEVWKVG